MNYLLKTFKETKVKIKKQVTSQNIVNHFLIISFLFFFSWSHFQSLFNALQSNGLKNARQKRVNCLVGDFLWNLWTVYCSMNKVVFGKVNHSKWDVRFQSMNTQRAGKCAVFKFSVGLETFQYSSCVLAVFEACERKRRKSNVFTELCVMILGRNFRNSSLIAN